MKKLFLVMLFACSLHASTVLSQSYVAPLVDAAKAVVAKPYLPVAVGAAASFVIGGAVYVTFFSKPGQPQNVVGPKKGATPSLPVRTGQHELFERMSATSHAWHHKLGLAILRWFEKPHAHNHK